MSAPLAVGNERAVEYASMMGAGVEWVADIIGWGLVIVLVVAALAYLGLVIIQFLRWK